MSEFVQMKMWNQKVVPALQGRKAVELEKASAGYHRQIILKDISLTIEQGEMVGVIGPNGAGKTTLLRCLTGLCRPVSGSVKIFGMNVQKISSEERAGLIAVVPQELETPMSFTVQEIVTIGRASSMSRWKSLSEEDERAIERAMVYTDVVDMKNRLFNELSGGEKQRAVVAMALAQEPRMILLDEATSHLDMNHRLEVMQIVERLNREENVTVLMVSHDLNLTAEFCNRIVLMKDGGILADGAPREVFKEEILSGVYSCDVRVQHDPSDGALSVVPARRLVPLQNGKSKKIHLIAGGGMGEELMRRLSLMGHTVTAGVLNSGDSDEEVAEALGLAYVREKPFHPVTSEVLKKAIELADTAEIVIVGSVPFGPGNIANLQIAETALSAGRKVYLMDGIKDRDYTPAKEAVVRFERLLASGAQNWRTVSELINEIQR